MKVETKMFKQKDEVVEGTIHGDEFPLVRGSLKRFRKQQDKEKNNEKVD